MKRKAKDQVSRGLTGYEYRIYKSIYTGRSEADLMKDEKMATNVFKQALATGTKVDIGEGEIAVIPQIVQLTALRLAYLKDHPDKIDLNEISKVLGESKNEQTISIQTAADVFKGCEATQEEPRPELKVGETYENEEETEGDKMKN